MQVRSMRTLQKKMHYPVTRVINFCCKSRNLHTSIKSQSLNNKHPSQCALVNYSKTHCGGTFLIDLILCIFNVIVNITCISICLSFFSNVVRIYFFVALIILYSMHVSCSFSMVTFSWEFDLTKTFSMMEKTLKHYEN